MSDLVITGWQMGFKKISMTKLIRVYTGYGLAEGKVAGTTSCKVKPVVFAGTGSGARRTNVGGGT